MSRNKPSDAMKLLLSPAVIEHACNVVRNPAFARASATTRDAHGRRVLDYVRAPEERRTWPDRLEALLRLPVAEFAEAMAREPVRLSSIPKPNGGTRDIVIPTFLRRCISNAFNEVLTLTSEALLPEAVRAYRSERPNAVQDAILDVAEAVHVGKIRYYAKLDFRSYFNEMRWSQIEESLRHYGYDAEFITRLMIVVRCPIVRSQRGRSVQVDVDHGAQMGLAESSVLANLLPWALDEQMRTRHPRVLYLRYSDDVFVGAREKREVVAATRYVAAWCRDHHLQLKGVENNARLAGQVHDVMKTKIPLLGAEIDQHGYVHMPASKLAQKLAELEILHERCSLEPVHGVSRYGNGSGVDAYDTEDLQRSAQAFLDYWSPLDPRGAERARRTMERRFPLTSVASSAEQGTVWAAQLWGAQTDREAGCGPLDPTTGLPMRTRMSPSATGDGALGTSLLEPGERTPAGGKGGTQDTSPSVPSPSGHNLPGRAAYASQDEVLGTLTLDGIASHSYGDDDLHMGPDRHLSDYRLETSSEIDREIDSGCGQEDHPKLRSLDIKARAVGDPAGGAPPPWPVFENAVIRYVHTSVVRSGTDYVVLIGRCDLTDGIATRVRVKAVRDSRPEAALVRQMIEELNDTRESTIVFGMQDTWLAKTLLQPHRTFRAPLLYGRVLELHTRARSRSVTLLGGLALPAELSAAIARARDGLDRRQALIQAGFGPAEL